MAVPDVAAEVAAVVGPAVDDRPRIVDAADHPSRIVAHPWRAGRRPNLCLSAIPVRYSSLLNYLFYQAGWFACVLGAAAGWPGLGLLVATTLIVAHLGLATDRRRELSRIALAVGVGIVVESLHIAAGTYQFTSGIVVAALPPPWLLVMWAQMATTFQFSLRPIMERPRRAAMFGALGGPIAFLAGERLGAVMLHRPLAPGMALLAITWAIAMTTLAFGEQVATRRDRGLLPPAR